MSAIGQPAPAPAPAATPAPGTDATQGQPTQQNDPWGFASHVAGAPEHLRGPLQTALDAIAPSLEQRFSQFAPLEPRMERLTPLLEADENGTTTLDGLVALYELFNDETRVDDLADWWENIGEQFEFFDDENGAGAGAGAAAAQQGAPGQPDLSSLDPGAQAIVQQLMGEVEGLKAQLGEFTTQTEQSRQEAAVNSAAQDIRNELVAGMKAAGIDGHEDLTSQNAQDILVFAAKYGPDPKAIEKGIADYARLTGRAQASQLEQQGEQLSGVEALKAALAGGGNAPATSRSLGHSLRGGADAHEPEAVRGFDDAKQIALQRFTASQRQ